MPTTVAAAIAFCVAFLAINTWNAHMREVSQRLECAAHGCARR